jgi:acetylornithine/succinyldiaminopimelate/putrescine aminotransferase
VTAGLLQHNVLAAFALNALQVLRLEPPAIITEDETELALRSLREALADTAALL